MTLMCGLLMALQPRPMDAPLSSVTLIGSATESQPAANETSPPAETPTRNVEAAPRPQPAKWTRIVIHESGQLPDSLADMERRYADKYNGCPYHFVIEADGTPRGSARWYRQEPFPAQLKPAGEGEVHIAIVGAFGRTPPTARQMAGRDQLVNWLVEKFGISPDAVDINPHANKPGAAYK